ncbi:MAG: hypothetical protein P4M11_06610 [Candidatus Pacebacteria bacterium]|nr:hypothetical protein [Candidatus Paceibacterota bacterium]
MQEVDHYETYRPELEKLGFSTEWKRKSAPACPDGPLVGYRKDRFQCLGKYEIEFDRVADSTQFDLKRGTVALALHLKCMKTGREVICANTHLFYHHSFNQIKYAQMAYLLSELAKIHKSLKDPEKIGVVICGDMNVWPDSNVIRLVYGLPPVETYPDISSEEHRQVLRYIWKTYGKPALEMASSYEGYMSALKGEPGTKKGGFEEVVKGHPPYTCITYTEYETLDYILYNKDA